MSSFPPAFWMDFSQCIISTRAHHITAHSTHKRAICNRRSNLTATTNATTTMTGWGAFANAYRRGMVTQTQASTRKVQQAPGSVKEVNKTAMRSMGTVTTVSTNAKPPEVVMDDETGWANDFEDVSLVQRVFIVLGGLANSENRSCTVAFCSYLMYLFWLCCCFSCCTVGSWWQQLVWNLKQPEIGSASRSRGIHFSYFNFISYKAPAKESWHTRSMAIHMSV